MNILREMRTYGKRLAALGAAAALLGGCAAQRQAPPPELIAPVSASVETSIARRGDVFREDYGFASVRARTEDLYFPSELEGYTVDRFECVEGDEVKAGDPILYLNTDAQKRELAQLAAELADRDADAQTALEIYNAEVQIAELKMKLAKEDGVSDDDYRLMQIALDKKVLTRKQNLAAAERTKASLLARVATLEEIIASAVLRAPSDGFIAKMYAVRGDRATDRNPAAVIADPTDLYIELAVNASVRYYSDSRFTALYDDKEILLTQLPPPVVNIAAGESKPPLTFMPADGVMPPDLQLGAFLQVRVVRAEALDVLYVPLTAVISTATDTYVYRMVDKEDGVSREAVAVRTGITNEMYAEIEEVLSGELAEGDVIFVKQ